MEKPRYSIVRVDKFCPKDLERNYKLKCIGSLHCDKCKIKKNYGDTKENLIAKVKQVITRRYQVTLEDLATEIVEFLGVNK